MTTEDTVIAKPQTVCLRTLIVDGNEGSHRCVDQREVHRGELDIALCVKANEEHSFFQTERPFRMDVQNMGKRPYRMSDQAHPKGNER